MFKSSNFPALFSSPAYSWKRPSSVVNGGEASERVDVRQSIGWAAAKRLTLQEGCQAT